MSLLHPATLFAKIADDIPRELHEHLFITGSLAAAYRFEARLNGSGVNTKDADVLVHPAGDVTSTAEIASRLLAIGWRRHADCFACDPSTPVEQLRAIRLYPPDNDVYFIEFLGLPEQEQAEAKRWLRIELSDGDYGLPSFRFMRVMALNRQRSSVGLEYASPSMMALANLLAHERIGTERMQSAGPMNGSLRSAKDLGRVLALAWFEGRDAGERWLPEWALALRRCFPSDCEMLALHAGDGLREILVDPAAFDEARRTTALSLLAGLNVNADALAAIARRLVQDAIDPLSATVRTMAE